MGSGTHGGCGSSRGGHADTALDESPGPPDLRRGLAEVSAVVPRFDAGRFPEEAMDLFFQIQGAWANRNLAPVRGLLGPEVTQEFQALLDTLKAEGWVNRLENIAVRRAEIQEAWVEGGKAFVTVHLVASLLDYTVEENTGRVVSGSKEKPVKFEEYWTFARPSGGSSWQLTAIQQPE